MRNLVLSRIHSLGAIALCCSSLIACGGGGSATDDNDDGDTSPPAVAAELMLNYDIKTFRFSWNDVSDASFYRLYENPDGVSGFSQISGDIAAGTERFDHYVALPRRTAASYYLQSCNAAGCTDSDTVFISGNLAEAVGYFKASNNGDQDQFGIAVSLSADGDTLAVGSANEDSGDATNPSDNSAPDSGAVYVYRRGANGWQFQQYLKASSIITNNFFGTAISLSADGNTLAVSAPGDIDDPFAAAVYIFNDNGSGWQQSARITASNANAGDNFGVSLALSNDGMTLAVGADGEASLDGDPANNDAPGAGAAYVFSNNGSGWSQQAYLKAGNSEQGDFFGRAVSLSGDGNTLAVGATGEDSANASDEADNTGTDTGAVYVFVNNGGWSQQAYLKAGAIDNGDNFGNALSLSDDGNTLAVGVPLEDISAPPSVGGAAYVFSRDASSNWSQQAYLKAAVSDALDEFGKSLSLSADGNSLLIGAMNEDSSANGIGGDATDNSTNNTGAAYLFSRDSGGSWLQSAYIKAANNSASEQSELFGYAVSLSGDGNTAAIGAKDEDNSMAGVTFGNNPDNNGALSSGAVYLY